jgi:hypothetical protein
MGVPISTYVTLCIIGIGILAYVHTAKVAFEGFRSDPVDIPHGVTEKSVDLVISRYKEDLGWLKGFKNYTFRKVIIYNKGEPFRPPVSWQSIQIVNIPNVGVCDHTYLHHIVTNYDDLADITVFLPGSADLPVKVNRMNDVLYRACELKKPTMYVMNVESVQKYQYNFELAYWRVSSAKNIDNNESYKLARASPKPFGKWFEYYLPGNDCPYIAYFGLFSLSRETIRKKPTTFYNKFLEQLKYDKFPEAAHYIERSWPAFFHPQPESEIKNYIN